MTNQNMRKIYLNETKYKSLTKQMFSECQFIMNLSKKYVAIHILDYQIIEHKTNNMGANVFLDNIHPIHSNLYYMSLLPLTSEINPCKPC